MSVLLITYDLNKETKRPNITKRLHESFDDWAMLSESSYAVKTGLDPVEAHAVFGALLDDDDQLYAIPLTRPYYGQGAEEVNGWLERNLR